MYVRAYRLTHDPLYADIVRETIRMTQQRFQRDTLFMSASDADSNHQEGGYFIYTPAQIEALHPSQAIIEAFDLKDGANFEGKIHLYLSSPKRPEEFGSFVTALSGLRRDRPYPFVDNKAITSWNAMMIEALYKAGEVDPKYTIEADKTLDALLKTHYIHGELYHQSIPGFSLTQQGLFEDYAFVISALLSGYEATLDTAKLELAQQLCDKAIAKFHTPTHWVQNEEGVKVEADLLDKYITSPFGRMMQNLFVLAALSEEPRYGRLAQKSLDAYGSSILDVSRNAPSSMIAWLMGYDGVVTVSHNEETLKHTMSQIRTIRYPYIALHGEVRDDFSACVSGACFANEKTLETLGKEIESFLKSR